MHMKNDTKKNNPPATDDQLQDVLERILELEAQQYAAILEQTPPEKMTAAMLTSARQFLESNGVSLDTLRRPGRGAVATARMIDQLRQVAEDHDDDEDDHGGAAKSGDHAPHRMLASEDDPPLPAVEWDSLEK
jgi:hypothetical protein